MANNFDEFPLYDKLTKGGDKMSDVWVGSISTFFQNIIGYLTQNGILLPLVTTAQRDAIQAPQLGQMIYNTTINSAQYWKNVGGTPQWVSF